MRTIHPLLLAKKMPFTHSKSQVIRLMSHIPQKQFPGIGYHNKERLRLVYTSAQYDPEMLEPNIDIGESANPSLLKWKHWPSTEGGTHGRDERSHIFQTPTALLLRLRKFLKHQLRLLLTLRKLPSKLLL